MADCFRAGVDPEGNPACALLEDHAGRCLTSFPSSEHLLTFGQWSARFVEQIPEPDNHHNALLCPYCTYPTVKLCSQCGEHLAVMVKIGTSDGWCAVCLDEAAQGEAVP